VVGPQIPEQITQKILNIFSTEGLGKEEMNFQDLLACYVLFKQNRQSEIAQLTYELIRLVVGAANLEKVHFASFNENILSLPGKEVQEFYNLTRFDPKLPITRNNFVEIFRNVEE